MPELQKLQSVIRQACEEAGRIHMRHLGRLRHIERKAEVSLVTEADRQAEEAIITIIRQDFPEHKIIAEESSPKAEQGNDYTWFIDPLDGTTNYAHALPIFAVSLGVAKGDRMLMGAVFNAASDEFFFAARGQGASLNGNPIQVSKVAEIEKALLVTGFAYDRREHASYYTRYFTRFIKSAQGVRRLGAAALDLCFVACGRFDGFYEEKLNPWDTAAGWLILEEAGGTVTDFDGNAYSPFTPHILATNGHIHQPMLENIQSIWHQRS